MPQESLFLFTDSVPAVLEPYRPAFKHNLRKLLHSCGFSVSSAASGRGVGSRIFLSVYFPERLTAPPRTRGAPDTPPSQLHIDDEFSKLVRGGKSVGTFTGGNFAQLLVDTLGGADVAVGTSGARKKRRRPSRKLKAEGDTNPATKEGAEDDEGLSPDLPPQQSKEAIGETLSG
ncbi:hypothetical protein DFH06DRAFT_1364661 [Mycena polygramma]|nr:hypothetical protein DFH06DRAFT_1364661 [Mycena polygramma]